jgi:hypothetical protein
MATIEEDGIYYACSTVVPFSYLVIAILEAYKHWSDGKDNRKVSYRYHIARCLLIVLIALLNFLNLVNCTTETDEVDDDRFALRLCYHVFATIAWSASFALLHFEYRRRLAIKWIGQKGFWAMSCLVNIGFIVFNIELTDDDDTQHVLRISIYCVASALSFTLTLLAIFKPNIYPIYTADVYKKIESRGRVNTQFSRTRIFSQFDRPKSNVTEMKNNTFEIKVKIRDYKTKLKNNRSVVFYNIYVTIDGETNMIRRNYSEFDALHKVIIDKFQGTDIPIPDFPLFTSAAICIEHRMKALSSYLDELCKPEYMIHELLNFLKISEDKMANITEERDKIVESDVPLSKSPKADMRHGSIAYNYYHPQNSKTFTPEEEDSPSPKYQNLFLVMLDKTPKSQEMTYILISCKIDGKSYSSEKSISDLHALHKNMSRLISPAKLPAFPTSSVFATLKHSHDGDIATRIKRLEYYLAVICNDLAYLNQTLLDFLGIPIELKEIWNFRGNFQYVLHTPITWESDVDESGEHFIVYALSISKQDDKNKTSSWTVYRRYKQFDKLHKKLLMRNQSPVLFDYLKAMYSVEDPSIFELPKLPSKTITSLSSHREIEFRRRDLEKYMQELLVIPHVQDSLYFREFIDDIGQARN